ncbi:hypothetical protein SMSP2_01029 [Limihaloglobus sulfuriphilus]|uniref:Uncharacterized protein n=1 Tax=Limihaloglobus sulfuriphilus TaxID=1851148 RepID=A0A1Q2MDA1_9BACT|nr:hypothetical protein SMSP2_01029 [Limihaloglobus sulfuriphilus]
MYWVYMLGNPDVRFYVGEQNVPVEGKGEYTPENVP